MKKGGKRYIKESIKENGKKREGVWEGVRQKEHERGGKCLRK